MATRLAPLFLAFLLCAGAMSVAYADCTADINACTASAATLTTPDCPVLNTAYTCLKGLTSCSAASAVITGLEDGAAKAGCTLSKGATTVATSMLVPLFSCLAAIFLRG